MRKAIEVLLVVDPLEVGGAERHVIDVAVAIRQRIEIRGQPMILARPRS